ELQEQAHAEFPILTQEPSPEQVGKALRAAAAGGSHERVSPNRYVTAYQLAIPACYRDPDDSSRCEKIPEYEALWGKFQHRREALRKIDVLFVLDKTTSMDAYWRATATAVNNFVRDFER